MSCVLRSACVALFLLAAGTSSFSLHAVERLQFSHWEFELPEILVRTISTFDRLVLNLAPSLTGKGEITMDNQGSTSVYAGGKLEMNSMVPE